LEILSETYMRCIPSKDEDFLNKNAVYFQKLHVHKKAYIDDVMVTRHLCHCEILQGKVDSQEVQ